MDASKLKEYEQKLVELEAEVAGDIEQSSSEAAPVEVDGRMGRISRGDAMQVQQVALEVKRRRKEHLLRVRSALQRIKQGAYGLCGRCNGRIDTARLDVQPDAVLCVRCAATPRRSW